jgi:hypothetical protein
MSMIADAIKALVELGRAADAPQPLAVSDPDNLHVVLGGKMTVVPRPLPPRGHKPETLDDLVALANRFAGADHSPVVWYSAGAVVVVLNDDDRRDSTATLELVESELFTKVRELAAFRRAMTQKELVRLLRIDLAGALEPAALLNPVRRMTWSSSGETRATVERNRESMGKDIALTVRADADIPEEVNLRVPVFANPGEGEHDVLVRCAVDVEPLEQTFRLIPLPGEVDNAVHTALADIAARLQQTLNDGVPAYQGTP